MMSASGIESAVRCVFSEEEAVLPLVDVFNLDEVSEGSEFESGSVKYSVQYSGRLLALHTYSTARFDINQSFNGRHNHSAIYHSSILETALPILQQSLRQNTQVVETVVSNSRIVSDLLG